MYDSTAITSVPEADEVRYERREAEKRGGNRLQMGNNNERPYKLEGHEEEGAGGSRGRGGQLDQGEHEGPHGPAGPDGPYGPDEQIWSASGPRPSAACRVNLSAAFEAEWSAHSNAALRLDS
jgi:hypothetical protein